MYVYAWILADTVCVRVRVVIRESSKNIRMWRGDVMVSTNPVAQLIGVDRRSTEGVT